MHIGRRTLASLSSVESAKAPEESERGEDRFDGALSGPLQELRGDYTEMRSRSFRESRMRLVDMQGKLHTEVCQSTSVSALLNQGGEETIRYLHDAAAQRKRNDA